MNDLELEIEQLEEEAASHRRQGNETGYILKMDEINQKRAELERLKQKETIYATASDPESSFILNVDGLSVDFRSLGLTEENYQLLTIAVQLYIQEKDQNHASEIALKDAQIALNAESYKALEEELDGARNDLSDARLKLGNAMNQISDKDIEIEKLTAENEVLRTTNKPKEVVQNNTDFNALREAMKNAENAKRAIYNVVKDSNGRDYTARYADTDEEFSDKVIYIGKYREISDEEARRFRQEREEAAQAELDNPAHEEVANGVGDFQSATQAPPLSSLDVPEHPVHGEMAPEHVEEAKTIKERLTALELAVFGKATQAAA